MNARPDSNSPSAGDAVAETGQAIDDDWFGPDLDRDDESAERALELAGFDEARADEIFEDLRPPHKSDHYDVPADERPV